MTWNTNITEAQTGDYVWLATKCGRVVKTYWIQGTKGWGCWSVAYADEGPIAWQPYVVPIHPFASAKTSEDALTKAPMNVSLPDADERSCEGANIGGLNDRAVKTPNPNLEHASEPVSSSEAPILNKMEEAE